MKTIIILLMIFGLYACDESTVTQPKEDTKVETQKHTLEEILADTNWVEITDTLHYDDIKQLSIKSIGWKSETFNLIKNNEDYENLKQKNDTIYPGYKPIELRVVDFNKYDLIGYFLSNAGDITKKMYFKNKNTKEVFYFIELIRYSRDGIIDEVLRYSQNWLLVPKIPNEYKIYYDLKVKYEER